MANNLVMLVDDDELVRRSVRTVITHLGYNVEDFAQGLSACRRLEELQTEGKPSYYELILSDIDMPQMNGITLANRCAEIAEHTPMVLMTGIPRDQYPTNVKEVLIKPFKMLECKRILDLYAPLKT